MSDLIFSPSIYHVVITTSAFILNTIYIQIVNELLNGSNKILNDIVQ